MKKIVRDGKVAVLYSPGYGAGWSTWIYENRDGSVFDPELVEAIEREASFEELRAIAEENYPGQHLGGLRDLTIEWVPEGSRFYIDEYDGSETVVVLAPDYGYIA